MNFRFALLDFRCTAVSDWLVLSGGCGCEGFDQSHRTLSTQEPAPDRLWLEWHQVHSCTFAEQTTKPSTI